VPFPKPARAADPRSTEGDPREYTKLGGSWCPDTATLPEKQRQIDAAGPSREAVAAAEEFILDEIYHALSLIASYTTSALEAVRRGDREELRLRLRVQLRDCFRHAVELHNLLPPVRKVASEAGRAAA
jgi:hypothetical protein